MFFFTVQFIFPTQHCCLSEMEMQRVSYPIVSLKSEFILLFILLHMLSLHLLADGQAEPNLQSQYQGGSEIGGTCAPGHL